MGDIDKYTVPQLKDFLRKFGISTSNYRKNVLITLAKAVRDMGLEEDPDKGSSIFRRFFAFSITDQSLGGGLAFFSTLLAAAGTGSG